MRSLFDPPVYEGIRGRLDGASPDRTVRWGRMTAPQVVCHLSDAFAGVMGDFPLTPPDVPWYVRSGLGRLVALTLPIRWPAGFPAPPEIRQEEKGTPPGDFDEDLALLRERMERFYHTEGRGLVPHPLWGPLRPGEWGRWGYRHMDHHLRQMGL